MGRKPTIREDAATIERICRAILRERNAFDWEHVRGCNNPAFYETVIQVCAAFQKTWNIPENLAQIGGAARNAKLTPKQRSASARKAVLARWAKRRAASPAAEGEAKV